MYRARANAGLTLVELLLVLAIIGVLLGMVMPRSDPSVLDALRGAARIMASDLAYARSLAITNNSKYRVTLDFSNNRLVLEHTGANLNLNTLPITPFSSPKDTPQQHFTDFDELPHLGAPVKLLAGAVKAGSYQPLSAVEFQSLGQTDQTDTTYIWLAAGTGAGTRYIAVTVEHLTGLASVDQNWPQAPPSSVLPSGH
jgi:prepilin-type N-terminal cleavage/methylation domain-containing protein